MTRRVRVCPDGADTFPSRTDTMQYPPLETPEQRAIRHYIDDLEYGEWKRNVRATYGFVRIH